jgi:hypothetical protein
MSELTELQQIMALVDKLVQVAGKDDLAECARLLAMNVAHYELRYGALPLEEQLTITSQFNGDQEELVICGAWKPWPAC